MNHSISALALMAALSAAPALAWEATEGRPFEGETVNVLAVKSSQFEAHEARLAEFEDAEQDLPMRVGQADARV